MGGRFVLESQGLGWLRGSLADLSRLVFIDVVILSMSTPTFSGAICLSSPTIITFSLYIEEKIASESQLDLLHRL
jgi:hypothetical protein